MIKITIKQPYMSTVLLMLADGLFLKAGVEAGNAVVRRRREVLGNALALPCAVAAMQRVVYLESIVEHD